MAIYLDHAATTPVRREVVEAMLPYLTQHWGNPSSGHSFGRAARAGLDGVEVNVGQYSLLSQFASGLTNLRTDRYGQDRLLLTERGSTFGYNTLVNDMRGLPIMAETGYPVVFDATHSVQQPGGLGGASGGQRQYAPVLARAAIAVGVAAVFIETHQDPDNAPSDGPTMIPLDQMPGVLDTLLAFDRLAKA